MSLIALTPEGRILLTLAHGQHFYGELKLESGLSDRWLTVKLKELINKGDIVKQGRWYRATQKINISATHELSLYMNSQAQRIAKELGNLPNIKLIVLFGSIAQKKAREYSDIDLIIVVSDSVEEIKKSLMSKISVLESKFHLTIEALVLSKQDFLENINSKEGGIVFGIVDGYEILLDKSHELNEALSNQIREIQNNYKRINEEGIWLKTK